MIYQFLKEGLFKYGVSEDMLCKMATGMDGDKINKNVIIAPSWKPYVFEDYFDTIVELQSNNIEIWEVTFNDKVCTYIRTGIGAPVLTDIVLGLGASNCEQLIFIGSVGSIDNNINIGDIVIPEYSICGDGTTRYLSDKSIKDNDVFGTKFYPDKELNELVIESGKTICEENNVGFHVAPNFSIDTVFAQFAHLDEIIDLGSKTIEMETAAAFKAAEICNIKLSAVFSVSDNSILEKSLYGGRSEEEQVYRKHIRKTIFPRIIDSVFNHTM